MKSKPKREDLNKSNNTNNSTNKDNSTFLENEISIITKKLRKELNTHNKIYRNHKLDLLQATNEYKIESYKFKKIGEKINLLEKEVESIHKKITKNEQKKIYSISSVIKFRKLYKQSNLEQYKSILNIGLNGPKNNFKFLYIIKESEEEFNYYLEFLEKYYTSLEKENKIEFNQIKKILNNLVNVENLSFPEDKLLFYLNYVVQIIDYKSELQIKSEELLNEKIIKNEVNSIMKKLEALIKEKNDLMVNSNDYIELLKNLIQKYIGYQKKYKNNLISKETLNKKIRKLQSINLQNFNNNKITNNNFFLKSNIKSPYIENDRYTKFIPNKNKNMSFKTPNIFPSKSQIVSRNISTDYLPEVEGPLTKKNNIENNEMSVNDMFFTLSINKDGSTERENVSDNSGNDSPVSVINITSRKKNLNNTQLSNKTTIPKKTITNKIPIPEFSINDLNFLDKKTKTKMKNSQIIYHKKKPQIEMNMKNGIFESKTKIKIKNLEKASLENDKSLIYNENGSISKDKNDKINFKRNLYFMKKTNKNKKFFINKEKLFNKELSKTLDIKKEKLNILNNNVKETKLSEYKKLNAETLKNCINSCDISLDDVKKSELSNNNIIIQKINNYYGPVYPKNYDDTIRSYKEEVKQNKYLYLKKKKIKKNLYNFRTLEIKNEINTENCCISCV